MDNDCKVWSESSRRRADSARSFQRSARARAIPALRTAAARIYDDFLKLTIGKAQLSVGDSEGFATLIGILKDDEAGYARQQANELLQSATGRKFGYNAELTAAQNATAIRGIEEWYLKEGIHARQDATSGVFK